MRGKNNPMVVERYTVLDRVAHTAHAFAMVVLILTGLKIYMGWDFMSFHNARALHMIMVPVLLAVNWILIPYNIFSASEGGVQAKMEHFMDTYIFGPDDAMRLKGIVLNFFGKGDYPAFTIYDEVEGHYKTKLHPLMKILIVLEGTAILVIAVSGIVLYKLDWAIFGLPVGSWILSAGDLMAPFLGMSSLQLMRAIHLLMTYWFVFELVVHIGILEFDPHIWKYYKAIFWSGKENLEDRHFVDLVGHEPGDNVPERSLVWHDSSEKVLDTVKE